MANSSINAASASMAAAYSRMLYPSSAFDHTHPERLATIAHLHGLAVPPIETARVLDIGGGDGVNLLAMAATLPEASFLSVDIASEPVRSGSALAAMAGLTNVRVEVADVLDLAETLDERFDYVIAHGVYAWVPDPVRKALMQTIGRVLSPKGVAFVSYNAEPGGRIRGILRELALAAIPENASDEDRSSIGRAAIAAFAEPRQNDSSLMRGVRDQAQQLVRRLPAELAHDELGHSYAPQFLAAVAEAASACGLAYLNDAERRQREEGFPNPALESEAALIRHLQMLDYENLRFFRHSLFVRRGRAITRHFDLDRLADLWLSFRGRRTGRHTFDQEGTEFELGDDRLCDVLEQAAMAFPHRLDLGALALGSERLDALTRLFDNRVCKLHFRQVPGVLDSERPRASPLALAQLARGDERITRLDQTVTKLDEDVRKLLVLLDGSRNLAQLAEPWSHIPAAQTITLPEAIRMLGRQALLLS